jgi:hypothetical protein
MNKTSLSLCPFGAALATANILIIQRPTCPSGGMEVAAADKDAPSTQTEVISTVKRKPPQAAKAAVSTAEAKPPDASAQAKPSQALKAVAKPSGPAPKDDVTGSVKQTAKTQEPNDEKPAVSPAQLAKSGLGPARVEDALEEWAEVSLAARVHNAPSVSAPTVRFYRVGTRLKVIGREPGWIKVVDPSRGMDLREVSHSKGRPRPKASRIAATITTASSGGYAQRHERLGTPSARALCTILQATQWMEVVPAYRPPIGFAFRVYPNW